MEAKKSLASLWIVDVVKAVASQLIVWHHFVSYGPMIRTVSPYAPDLVDWLGNVALMAVQAFLVVGGFLSVRSLASPQSQPLPVRLSPATMARLAWRRYVRLMRPYLPALVLAIAFAALARLVISDPDTPAAPSFVQVLYHVLLLQDIAGADALSTGVWYVAIDLQLYCLMLLALWAAQRLAAVSGVSMQFAAPFLVLVLAAFSALWFNREETLETWAVYFFGAYALGMMAHWCVAGGKAKYSWFAALLLVYALALVVEWRTRLVVSLATAAILLVGVNSGYRPGAAVAKVLGWFSRISYPVFLIHYPVVLVVGAVFARIWPGDAPMFALGFLVSWAMTLVLASVLHSGVEAPSRPPLPQRLKRMEAPAVP